MKHWVSGIRLVTDLLFISYLSLYGNSTYLQMFIIPTCENPAKLDPALVSKGYTYETCLCFDESLILCHLLSEPQQKNPSLTRVSQGWEGEMEEWIEDYRAVESNTHFLH